MTDKAWPDSPKMVDMCDLVNPAEKAIRQIYSLQRKGDTLHADWPGIDWSGYNTPSSLATCFSPAETLAGERLRYSEEDQGRDPLTEIIGIIFRLGLEQGIRKQKAEIGTPIDLIRLALSTLERGNK